LKQSAPGTAQHDLPRFRLPLLLLLLVVSREMSLDRWKGRVHKTAVNNF
jgi:hypothetical protein